jgi:hypothetical protein
MTLQRTRPVRSLALAAVIGAVAAPAASAIPVEQYLPSQGSSSDQPVSVRVVEVSADHGFDWGDAGLGATGVLALAAIAGGAAVATGRRPSFSHNPHPS